MKVLLSHNGNNPMVTIIDRITKHVGWLAMSERMLMAVSFPPLFIEYYVWVHGVPLAIMSNKDVYFQSTFWKSFMAALGTKLYFSTAFHI
jgi:imidazoleglycerol phosphate synthase glutamine amidotransferase subunit HisH